ncbi:hypothetical protein ACSXEK_16265 (plasmid) [Clostridium perfringens]|uniref:hypothetical protein n=1 Tax=Clostridium perfringens TaxID=1502 RepID=UPI003748801F
MKNLKTINELIARKRTVVYKVGNYTKQQEGSYNDKFKRLDQYLAFLFLFKPIFFNFKSNFLKINSPESILNPF